MKNKLFLFAVLLGLGMAFSLTACKGDCNSETCINGTCDPDDKDKCNCTLGWEGDACDTYAIDKFLGNYDVTKLTLNGSPGSGEYEDTLVAVDGEPLQLLFTNFNGWPDFDPIATLDDGYQSFSIPETALDGTSYTVEGTGTIEQDGTFFLSFFGTDGGGVPYTREYRYVRTP